MIQSTTTLQEMLNQMTVQFIREIIVDIGKCTACMDCVEACKQAIASEHTKIDPVARIRIKAIKDNEKEINIPLLCRNCADAPCVASCMTACRIRDETGWVTTDYERCVGCWMCVMSCPFGVIEAIHKEKLARKCDGCTNHEIPPCVAICEPEALQVEGYSNFTQVRRRNFARRAFAVVLAG